MDNFNDNNKKETSFKTNMLKREVKNINLVKNKYMHSHRYDIRKNIYIWIWNERRKKNRKTANFKIDLNFISTL